MMMTIAGVQVLVFIYIGEYYHGSNCRILRCLRMNRVLYIQLFVNNVEFYKIYIYIL